MDKHVERVRAAMELKRWSLAQESLTEAFAETPNSALLHVLQAEVHLRQGDYVAATDSAREAIALAPDWSAGYFWLTYCLLTNCMASGDAERLAADAANTAIECDPDDPDNYAARAQVARFGQKHEQALRYAEQGLRIDPEHLPCLRHAAEALVALARNDAAESTLRRILSLEPESLFAHEHLARLLLAEGRRAEAYEHVRVIIRLAPDNADVRDVYGEVVRHQHPLARWLLVSSDWWYKLLYLVLPLGLLPLASLEWISVESSTKRVLAVGGVLWLLLCGCYPVIASAAAEGLIAFSGRFNQLLPGTRHLRSAYVVGILGGTIALGAVLAGIVTQTSQPLLLGGNALVALTIWYFARSAATERRRIVCLSTLVVPLGLQLVSLLWQPTVYGGSTMDVFVVLASWAVAIAVALKVSDHEYGR